MNMHDCPKFSHCSAPICPLDAEWARRSYLKGEAVCFYVLEAVKPGAEARFQGSTAKKLYQAIETVLPGVIARYAPLKRALARAAQTASKMGKQPPRPKQTKGPEPMGVSKPGLVEHRDQKQWYRITVNIQRPVKPRANICEARGATPRNVYTPYITTWRSTQFGYGFPLTRSCYGLSWDLNTTP